MSQVEWGGGSEGGGSEGTDGLLFIHMFTILRFGPGYSDNPDTCTCAFSISVFFNLVVMF